jgi:hypothetical protein
LPLSHVPPPVASVSVIDVVGHIEVLPMIAAGVALTVTVALATHVFVPVKVTIAVPTDTPYTRPDGLMVAVPTGFMAQVPLPVASDKKLIPVVHSPSVPEIEAGRGFTVTG